jgi:hypothetical protein
MKLLEESNHTLDETACSICVRLDVIVRRDAKLHNNAFRFTEICCLEIIMELNANKSTT